MLIEFSFVQKAVHLVWFTLEVTAWILWAQELLWSVVYHNSVLRNLWYTYSSHFHAHVAWGCTTIWWLNGCLSPSLSPLMSFHSQISKGVLFWYSGQTVRALATPVMYFLQFIMLLAKEHTQKIIYLYIYVYVYRYRYIRISFICTIYISISPYIIYTPNTKQRE